MPLACSAILFCTNPSLSPPAGTGRRDIWVAAEERHLAGVEVRSVDGEGRAKEGNSTRAVRRKVVVGIMLDEMN